MKTPAVIRESASTLMLLDKAICQQATEMGQQRLEELFKKGQKLDFDDDEAMRVYFRVSRFVEEKKRLALFLIETPGIFEADSNIFNILSTIALDRPLAADQFVSKLFDPQPGDDINYNIYWSYLDQKELFNKSWDDFLSNYSLGQVIQGQLDARCLLTTIPIPREIYSIIEEMRICFAFGQCTAVCALCRTLIESAITDICLRLGCISQDEANSDSFFKDYPPSRRILAITRPKSDDREEAFRLYKETSRIIHGTKAPKGSEDISARSIRLVERLYQNHARLLETE